VRAGERIRARIRLESSKELEGSFKAVFAITIEAEGAEKPCCVAEWIVLYFS
jgi:acyl dehydratase